MGTTILAVDDSATMRKILEITFSSSNFRLVAVASSSEAKKQLSQGGVGLMICDNSLEDDGYEVAKALKSAAPQVPLLFLSSRQNPYDGSKGASAHVDDHMDKPFDTQQLLDRVAKLAAGGPSAGAAAHAAPSAPTAASAAHPPAPAVTAAKPAVAAPKPAPAPIPSPSKAAGFGAGGFGSPKPAAQATPAPAPVAARPAVAAPAPQPAPAARASAPVAAAVTAASNEMAAKVGSMGLSPAEAQAILALSRDLIEKVIWEVVPVMAETLIKEEIARLTK